jgi:hypothetical protein
VAVIVVEVCKIIWNTLVMEHMPEPTVSSFKDNAKTFWERWQFPNCMGAIGGKHIRIKNLQILALCITATRIFTPLVCLLLQMLPINALHLKRYSSSMNQPLFYGTDTMKMCRFRNLWCFEFTTLPNI